MSFPPSFLEELRARLPLSEVVGKQVRLTRAGREYKACCPFHNEKSPSFYVNDDKQFFHCFGCGAHGDIIGFTMRHGRLSFPEAVEALAAQAGLTIPQESKENKEQYDREKVLLNLLDRATLWFEEQLQTSAGREAKAYLEKRGLGDEAIKRHRLGYAPADAQALIRKLTSEGFALADMVAVGLAKKSEDREGHYSFFRNRVIFPVGDRRGRTVAFGGRVMGDGEPKYLNSPDHVLFHKGKLLYGLSRARAALQSNQPLIVVEGYMDVIALVEAGYTGAVAPLGTALTEDQISVLWKLLPPLDARETGRDYSPILCFDGDKAGLRAAERAVERILPLLTPSQTVRIATMPEGQDPDELLKASGKSAMDSVLKQSKPMVDALWDIALAGRRLQTPEDRAALTANLKASAGRIANETLRQLYMDEVQKRLSSAFNWRGTQQANTQNRPWTGNWAGNWAGKKGGFAPEPPLLTRKAPTDGKSLRERMLLALIINHPALFHEFGENLAHSSFTNPALETLRQATVDILSHEDAENLDSEAIIRHLGGETEFDANQVHSGLAVALSDTTYMHAPFARPGQTIEVARQGWKSIWNRYLQELLMSDLNVARRRYAENASDENYARLMALREQAEGLAQTEESMK